MRKRIPNVLSASRIAIAPVLILLSWHLERDRYVATIVLVVVSMLTDALDGYCARLWRVTSETGYVLDAMGDRAIHLALVLVTFSRYELNPLLMWLLIFRDIGIYGVRVLSKRWLQHSKHLRWLSLVHATSVRVWLALYLARDGLRVFSGHDALNGPAFEAVQQSLIWSTVALSYYGLYRSLDWLVDREHETL